MANKTIQSLRGMKDIVNEESALFTYFVDNASKIAKNYGFSYIETPLLEETALFKRSVGESSDIVNKEMYQFIDKGENDVCLRPEGTAGVVRHFVEKKLDRAGGNYKWYYYGPMFRYERPQKGRLREFHQFGCEVFGISNVYEDANIIMLIKEILEYFGIGFTLKLNSLGCVECMPQYKENLVNHLNSFKEELCEDCNRRVTTNPIRVLDCKNEKCQTLLKDAPKITNSLCSSCDSDFEKLNQGYLVICDRYVPSNIAHQTAKYNDIKEKNGLKKWIEELEYNIYKLPKPDLIFFLNMNPDISDKLILNKAKRDYTDKKKDLHENDNSYLKNVYHTFCEMVSNENWENIMSNENDNLKTIEEIQHEIIDTLAKRGFINE